VRYCNLELEGRCHVHDVFLKLGLGESLLALTVGLHLLDDVRHHGVHAHLLHKYHGTGRVIPSGLGGFRTFPFRGTVKSEGPVLVPLVDRDHLIGREHGLLYLFLQNGYLGVAKLH